MARRSGQWGRQSLVWLHAVTSIGWMSFALALCVLLISGPGGYDSARVLDKQLLAHLGTSAAFTGLMLSGLTAWGYLRHWWVLVKFVITLTQLVVGMSVLSPRLDALAGGDAGVQIASSALMAAAIAFQAWLSVTKPWRHTPWTDPRRRTPSFPNWLYWAAVAVPVLDFVVWKALFGSPAPLLSLLIAVAFPFYRRSRLRAAAPQPVAG
ncbi:hypothetical protein Cs7R123_14760 [Catellatospora sp. TT07R-123]|uniref:hypothetical protein n=1 Tax=Catellatospora sp. TT07R-123 TaxID=2733863 RepID=UPI001B049C31|nr:hypothetical protein [Catellatospora sp. TT07R-123]GHJ44134.1 hypothetical protein Cs7R123_14760 [Catellatospora sp. TT07R-123]